MVRRKIEFSNNDQIHGWKFFPENGSVRDHTYVIMPHVIQRLFKSNLEPKMHLYDTNVLLINDRDELNIHPAGYINSYNECEPKTTPEIFQRQKRIIILSNFNT